MAIIQVRVDDNTKVEADLLFESLGLDTSTAVRMFLFKALNFKGIPFTIEQSDSKPVKKNTRAAMLGCLRSQYKLSDDFDSPLEDFKEYMQ